MAIQSDGKIVVSGHGMGAGTGLVARLDTDGSLDTTFAVSSCFSPTALGRW